MIVSSPRFLSTLALLAWAAAACGPTRPGQEPQDGGPERADRGTPTQPGDGGDAATPDSGPQHLRLVTWNVRDLFDTRDDPDTYDEVSSRPALQTKLSRLGEVLRGIDADIVLLQEVENQNVLQSLAEGPLGGLGYEERILFEGRDPRGIDVAALSRLPLLRVASHLEERFPSPDGSGTRRFARDLLEVFVRAGGRDIIVATTHFRSQRDGAEADAHRLAEATQTRRIVSRRAETGYPLYLLAGDLNDVPGSEALNALTSGGTLRHVVPMTLPEAERWSYRVGSQRVLIDHALASPALLASLRSMTARFERSETVWSASDHAPLVVDLVFESP